MNFIDLEQYHIKKEDKIIVGVSGGADSMALLHLLLQSTSNQNIIVAHVHHNVRKESDQEQLYLKKLCEEKGLIFESTKLTEYKEHNFENEARKKRYQFYEKILQKYHSNHLFLAHHGDDLVETVLMKIIRGSNLTGYAGIKEISSQKNYFIIRPLLSFTKEEILTYNQKNHITYFNDITNEDIKYTRNRYRKKILPFLKEEDSFVHQKFLHFSKTLQEYDNYINKLAKEKIEKYHKNYIDIAKFQKEDELVQKNIIYLHLVNLYNNQENIIKEKHIQNIIQMTKKQSPNIEINLPKDYKAIKEYNKIYFTKEISSKEDYKIELNTYHIIDNHIIERINKTEENGNNIYRLNSKNLNLPLYLRNKKEGDVIEVKNLNGKKKVKDIFIEKKIPLRQRKQYPILVDSQDNILWIPNIKKSKFNTVKNENYDIILKYHEKERKEENE